MMHIVVALGGNALLQRGQPLEAEILQSNVEIATQSLAPLADEHHLTFVHGNGPQVGLLALQANAYKDVNPYPFDILDAESQGLIGYLLQQALCNYINKKSIVTLLTQVVVDENDPAFNHPTKPIGPVYNQQQAESLNKIRGWTIKPDGEFFRRVIASPKPKRIYELSAIKTLINNGHFVIVGGGGGIPCIEDNKGQLHGVEAVIDKDLTACLIALELKADALMILTDVDAVYRNWGETSASAISNISTENLKSMAFNAGSMLPKVMAACQFVENSGKPAMIGALHQAKEILQGTAGTTIL